MLIAQSGEKKKKKTTERTQKVDRPTKSISQNPPDPKLIEQLIHLVQSQRSQPAAWRKTRGVKVPDATAYADKCRVRALAGQKHF